MARPERALLAAVAVLAAFGAVMVYSATAPLDADSVLPGHFARHGLALALGALLALAASRLPFEAWRVLALPLWALGVAGLVATALGGVRVNGAMRWLELPGGLVFQPGELAKWATLLAVAALVARREGRGPLATGRVLAALAVTAIPAGLLLLQPDLGNAVVLLALAGLVVFVAGARPLLLLAPAVLAGAGVLVYVALQPYALRRWVGFLDPWATAHEQGFQLVQSFVAFARGGLAGVGLGYGRQKLHYLPEAHTDFILSVVAEELGLLGVLVVLASFALLVWAGIAVALRARRRFPALVAFAMTLLLALPAALNAGVVTGLMPTKGLTLPFLSYGRTSLVISCLALGLVLGVARREGAPPARAGAART